jgi:zinc protease
MLGDIMFGDTSEIYAKLVLNEQKVQMLGANFGLNRDPNLNAIMAMVKKIEDVEYVKAEIDRTLKKYQAELMDAKRLEDLKSNLKYSFLMRLSSTADVAGSLPEIIAISGGIDALDRYYTTLQTITPEDIRQAAIKYFTDHRKTEILVRGE